jgi:hypothetical protein
MTDKSLYETLDWVAVIDLMSGKEAEVGLLVTVISENPWIATSSR